MADIQTDEKARNIVKTIVDMCRNLGVPCVAEGVETEGQAKAISETGCGYIQGFYFGRPISSAAVLTALSYDQNLAEHQEGFQTEIYGNR